jgi:hypothetical protein
VIRKEHDHEERKEKDTYFGVKVVIAKTSTG